MNEQRERPLLATDRVALALRNGWQTQDRRPVNGKNGKPRKAAYQVGDLAYVREGFGYVWPEWCHDGIVDDGMGWREITNEECSVVFRSSKPDYKWWSDEAAENQCTHWQPNIHMPKRIARTWLRVLDVSQEWLPDLSEADAIAEGCDGMPDDSGLDAFGGDWVYTPQQEFWKMWKEIYPTAEMYVWRYGLELAQR